MSFYYSPEKAKLLEPLIERFNASGARSGGKRVFIDGRNIASGEAEAGIASGKLKPVLWSPASSFWGRLLNYEADQPLAADENPSIVRTPLVIAMWEELADAYGYPGRELGYEQLAELAVGGWAAVGKPQFGPFKYVHTNPDFSTSGLSAVAASYYAAADKREGLTVEDIARTRGQVKRLERSIVHYGDTTLFISDEMRRHGLGYASAAAMEETTLIDFNRKAGDGRKLVAVYPSEGTFFSDNPLITLQGDWVTRAQKQAARVFADYLAREITPEVAGAQGFRPADETAAPAGLVTTANGVDPKQPERVLRLPEPRVLARIKEAWREDRKPANVMVVLDNSGSMDDENKLEHAKDGLKAFLAEAAPQDRIGLTKFSNQVDGARRDRADVEEPQEAAEGGRRDLPGGGHARARRDRRGRARGGPQARQGRDQRGRRAHRRRRHGVGPQRSRRSRTSSRSRASARPARSACSRSPTARSPTTSSWPATREESGGKAFIAGTQDIETVYREISSFF